MTACPTRILCPWDSPGKNTGVECPLSSPGDLPHPGIKPVSFALAAGFFTTEPPGKPQGKTFFFCGKNTRIVSILLFHASLATVLGCHESIHESFRHESMS